MIAVPTEFFNHTLNISAVKYTMKSTIDVFPLLFSLLLKDDNIIALCFLFCPSQTQRVELLGGKNNLTLLSLFILSIPRANIKG